MGADSDDACAVNSLVETPGCNPVAGRVVRDPVHSVWNGGMLAGALTFGPLTFSPSAFAVFLLSTGATLLIGHSVGFHRRLIHGSFKCPPWLERALVWMRGGRHERTLLDDPHPRSAGLGPAATELSRLSRPPAWLCG